MKSANVLKAVKIFVAKILKPRSEVNKYLQQFNNLKVVKIEKNEHAKPGGSLHNIGLKTNILILN